WLFKSLPHSVQKHARCSIMSSGASDLFSVFPSCPGWPPTFRSHFCLRLLVRGIRFSSLEGGIELLVLSFRVLYFSNSSSNLSIFASNLTIIFACACTR